MRSGARLPEEVEQGPQLERRRHDAEDQRGAEISAGLPLVFLDRAGNAIHAVC